MALIGAGAELGGISKGVSESPSPNAADTTGRTEVEYGSSCSWTTWTSGASGASVNTAGGDMGGESAEGDMGGADADVGSAVVVSASCSPPADTGVG